MSHAKLVDLKNQLEAMPGHQRLLIASELMKQGKADIAVVIAENVCLEYHAAEFFGKPIAHARREEQT